MIGPVAVADATVLFDFFVFYGLFYDLFILFHVILQIY